MDLSALPDDFFVNLGKVTKAVYRDQYPAIDPRSPALSQKGKVVIVTGASQGLGREVRDPPALPPLSYSSNGTKRSPDISHT